MTVALPTSPAPMGIDPQLLDFGGVITPSLGGVQQRLNRVGNRWAITVQLPPMPAEPLGRQWVAALAEGLTDTVLLPWPQVDFAAGSPGATLVNGANQTGSTLNIDGFAANFALRRGQFFSVIVSSQRYLYQVRADINANGAGAVALPITPMIRKSPADNAVCEFAAPMIEGFLQGSGVAWSVDVARMAGLQFTIAERA